MGEFFGAEPNRLRELADRLSAAADEMQRQAVIVRGVLQAWDSALSCQPMFVEAARLHDDAKAMSRRADLAQVAGRAPDYGAAPAMSDPDWRIGLPWDPTDAEVTDGARLDAARLAVALRSPRDAGSREIIAEVGRTLENRRDDPAYLNGFFANGGAAQLAGLARALHGHDGTRDLRTLSQESEQTLNRYAGALAAATTMAESGKLHLPPGAFDPLTTSGDMWSVGMLVRHGPPGDAYGTVFLSALGRTALDWQQHTYGTAPGPQIDAATASIPTWYQSLDLYPGEPAQLTAIRANNPALNILDRLGQNAAASRELLTGADGLTRAGQLIDPRWASPFGGLDNDAAAVAAVITAATTDRTPANAERSAIAAGYLIRAASAEFAASEKRDPTYLTPLGLQNYPELPANLSRALATLGSTYTIDLARSAATAVTAETGPSWSEDDKAWMVVATQEDLTGLLQLILRDPRAAGVFRGAVDAKLTATAQLIADGKLTVADVTYLGRLRGNVELVKHDQRWGDAQKLDESNARAKMYFEAVTGGLGNAPGPQRLGWGQVALGAGGTIAKESLFPTDNVTKAEAQSDRAIFRAEFDSRTPIAQGLLSSTNFPRPTGESWLGAGGRIRLDTHQQRRDFDRWWAGLDPVWLEYEQKELTGFHHATGKAAANSNDREPT